MSKLKAFNRHICSWGFFYMVFPPILFAFANMAVFGFETKIGGFDLYSSVFILWGFLLVGLMYGSGYLIKRKTGE